MFRNLLIILFIVLLLGHNTYAKGKFQYPNISGSALFEIRTDKIRSSEKENIKSINNRVNVDADFSLNFNQNWSLITDWKFKQVRNRDTNNPERYRTILSNKRGIGFNDEGLVVEQLKGQFENDDAKIFLGKFNPSFGSAFRKEKRIGVFTTDFTKDYELREKIGVGLSALLESHEFELNMFFNDRSALNGSAVHKRDRDDKLEGLPGNNSKPSSYVFSIKGEDLFGVGNLVYNIGYRNLEVKDLEGRGDETGFVGGLEYLIPMTSNASLIPFVEAVSIKNFSGESNRDAKYYTVALVVKYKSWTTSVSSVTRDIEKKNAVDNVIDRQVQYSVGYKFDNNISIDISRAEIKEDRYDASIIGVLVSYVYNF